MTTPHPATSDRSGVARLASLYDDHALDVERWVQRLAGPWIDVPDLVHDVFVIAFRRWETFRGESSAKTWLFRITERTVWKRRRRAALRRWFSLTPEDEAALPSDRLGPLETVERSEDVRRLYAALDQLPEKYRTAVLLYDLDGLSGEEAATLMGIQVGALWVRVHRAREKLLRILNQSGNGRGP